MTMRALTHWILISTLMWGSVGQTTPARRAETPARRMVESVLAQPQVARLHLANFSAERVAEAVRRQSVTHSREAAVGVGHTILFLLIIAGIDLTVQQIRREGLSQTTAHPERLAAIAFETAGHLLNNGSVWAGIIGASIMPLAQYPARAIAAVFAQEQLRRTLRVVLQRGILSTLAFVGWEFGAQLWDEAALLLPDPQDRTRATRLHGLLGGLMAAGAPANPEQAANRRVARAMIHNMGMIVLYDSNLRSQWMDRTWRLRVLTGEFSTLLGSMIASSAIGTAIFPGAGTLIGFVFGLVGGVVALFIPQNAKDLITAGFQNLRLEFATLSLASNLSRLQRAVYPRPMIRYPTDAERIADFRAGLEERRVLRERAATIVFEHIFVIARAWRNEQVQTAPALAQINRQLSGLVAAFENDRGDLRGLDRLALSTRPPQAIVQASRLEQQRVATVSDFIRNYALDIADNMRDQRANRATAVPQGLRQLFDYVEANRHNGFSEAPIAAQWNAIRAQQ